MCEMSMHFIEGRKKKELNFTSDKSLAQVI